MGAAGKWVEKSKVVVFCNSDYKSRSLGKVLTERELPNLVWTGDAGERVRGSNGVLEGFLAYHGGERKGGVGRPDDGEERERARGIDREEELMEGEEGELVESSALESKISLEELNGGGSTPVHKEALGQPNDFNTPITDSPISDNSTINTDSVTVDNPVIESSTSGAYDPDAALADLTIDPNAPEHNPPTLSKSQIYAESTAKSESTLDPEDEYALSVLSPETQTQSKSTSNSKLNPNSAISKNSSEQEDNSEPLVQSSPNESNLSTRQKRYLASTPTSQSKQPRILITTGLLSRGLDFSPNVSTVVLVEQPQNVLDFVHRAGRAGRAGRKGKVLVFGGMPGERFRGLVRRGESDLGVRRRRG